jgi:hypothetical protein
MILKEMEERDHLEQLNAQKARLKREEHKREAARLLEERKKDQVSVLQSFFLIVFYIQSQCYLDIVLISL